jgi:peroxiredoxin/predicted 2-oxoglutarate/Fe(II)-dependent dioxygenase YbiX
MSTKRVQKRAPLSRGDRAPNFFLPDHLQAIISLYDKVRGGPIVLFFYREQTDETDREELQRFVALAPEFHESGAHLFAIGGGPVAAIAALAQHHELGPMFAVADPEHKAAASYGVDGKCAAFLLDPNQRVLQYLEPGDTAIADRALDAVRRLPSPTPTHPAMHPPVLLIPGVFDADFCRYLIAQFWARGNSESSVFRVDKGKVEHVPNHADKRRRDHYVTDDDLHKKIGGILSRRVIPEIRRAFQFQITRIEQFKIVCYDPEPGGYFRPHRDNTSPPTAHRRFAMTLNLNAENYEGGELCFPEYGGARYRPATGDAVVFSCNLLHEATDVTGGKRYVLLSFLFDEAGQKQRETFHREMEKREAQKSP